LQSASTLEAPRGGTGLLQWRNGVSAMAEKWGRVCVAAQQLELADRATDVLRGLHLNEANDLFVVLALRAFAPDTSSLLWDRKECDHEL
jgi:hypothetical protein